MKLGFRTRKLTASSLGKLFPLLDAVAQNKSAMTVGSAGVRVRFAAAAWNYGLSIPLDKTVLEKLKVADRRAVVSLAVHCFSGNLEAALVDSDFKRILDAAAIAPSEKSAEISLLASKLGEVGGIIVRTLGPETSLCDVLVQQVSVTLPDPTAGAAIFAPVNLRPLPGWSSYYGRRADTIAEKLRSLAYDDLRAPLVMPWVGGLQLWLQPNNDMCRAIAVSGLYEPRVMLALQAALPKGGTFVDVGANMGMLTVYAAHCVGPTGSVHAFEPSPRDFGRLADNIALNNLQRVVTASESALGERSGAVRLHIADERHSGLNTLAPAFAYNAEEIAVCEVPMITLDRYVSEKKVDRIDLIKLDIEGAELLALKGARDVLTRLKPGLILEVLPNALAACGGGVDELEDLLASAGYSFFQLLENQLSPQPIRSLRELTSETLFAVAGSKASQ